MAVASLGSGGGYATYGMGAAGGAASSTATASPMPAAQGAGRIAGDTVSITGTTEQSQVGYSQSTAQTGQQNMVEMIIALLILELLMGDDQQDNPIMQLMNAMGGSESSSVQSTSQYASTQSSVSMSSGSAIDVTA